MQSVFNENTKTNMCKSLEINLVFDFLKHSIEYCENLGTIWLT